LGYATRLGLDDPAEVTVGTDLATTEQRTIDPRLLALQRVYAELAGEVMALRNQMDRLERAELCTTTSSGLVCGADATIRVATGALTTREEPLNAGAAASKGEQRADPDGSKIDRDYCDDCDYRGQQEAEEEPQWHRQVDECPAWCRVLEPRVVVAVSLGQAAGRRATTSFQVVNRVFISRRNCWAVSRWRPGRKCGDIPLNADRNLWAPVPLQNPTYAG
jgi:hypothetical protein